MAETFESFGVNLSPQLEPEPKGWTGLAPMIRNRRRQVSPSAEDMLQVLPKEVLAQFSKLAELGLFGEGGIEALRSSMRKQGGLQRSRLARSLKQRAGRRLGPRSGAIDTMIANDVYAPSFAGEEEGYRNLQLANQQSKLSGLSGIENMLRFFQEQFQFDKQMEAQKPGILDFAGPLLDIASLGFAPATGGASVAANQAINPNAWMGYGRKG